MARSCHVVHGGIGYWRARSSANAQPRYSTQPASIGNLTPAVTANGRLQPTRAINIGSALAGTVLLARNRDQGITVLMVTLGNGATAAIELQSTSLGTNLLRERAVGRDGGALCV